MELKALVVVCILWMFSTMVALKAIGRNRYLEKINDIYSKKIKEQDERIDGNKCV